MKKILVSSLLCSSLLLAANSNYNYEFTPMVGAVKSEGNLDIKNQKVYGFSLGRYLSEDSMFDQLELGILNSTNTKYEIGDEKTKITRFFTNVIKEYGVNDKMSFYSLAGLGYEKYSKELLGNEDDGFVNYGIGLKYKLSQNVSLKTDVRHLITFDGNNHILYTLGLGIAFGEKAKPSAPMTDEPVMIEKPKPVKKTPINEPIVVLDDDMDGVPNQMDNCPDSKKGAIVNHKGCDVVLDLNINFDTNSAIIKSDYNNKINDFANLLKKHPTLKAKINAHTDSDGSLKHNEILSQKRADSAVQALVDLNIDASRLESEGFGETQPIASNKTKEGKAQNRRVEALIKK